jgi:hypothetical protein
MSEYQTPTLMDLVTDITSIRYDAGFGSPFEGMSLARISDLEVDPDNQDVLMNTMGKVVVAMVVRYKKPLNKSKDFFKGNQKSTQTDSIMYERMIMLRDLSSPPGTNMFAILLSTSRNSRVWDAFLHVSHLNFVIYDRNCFILLIIFSPKMALVRTATSEDFNQAKS